MTHHSSPATPLSAPPAIDPELISGPAPDAGLVKRPRVIVIRELTPNETFTVLVAMWVECKAEGRMLAVPFVTRLADQRLLQSAVRRLMEAIDQLPSEAQALAIELVTGGAFTRQELRDPKQITAYFARSDWMEIVAAWRASPLPTVEQVIRGIEADRRQKAKQTTAPPPVSTGSGRGNRDSLASLLKAVLPSRLRDWATDFAEAVRALAEDPLASMDATALATAVKLRRPGTGTKVCGRVIASGLPHLVQHGFVIVEGGKARIHPGALV